MKRVPVPSPPTFSVNVAIHEASQQARDHLESPEKVARSTTNYRPATSPSRCGTCDHGDFPPAEHTGMCAKVAGPVQSGMVCSLYANERVASYNETSEVEL